MRPKLLLFAAFFIAVALAQETWYNSDVTTTLTCADAQSGCRQVCWCLETLSACDARSCTLNCENVPSRDVTATAEGRNCLWYYAIDAAGNQEAQKLVQVNIDKTLPAAGIAINSGAQFTTSRDVTLSLSYSDALSGIRDCRYSNDAPPAGAWEGCAATKAWTLSAGNGIKFVYYEVRDNAGNVRQARDDIELDTTAFLTTATPVGTAGQNNWYISDVSVRLACSGGTSACKEIYFCVGSGCTPSVISPACSASERTSCERTVSPAELKSDGTKTVRYYSVNVIDQRESVKSLQINIDKTDPPVSMSSDQPAEISYRTDVTATSTSSDATSGIAQHMVKWKIAGTAYELLCNTAGTCAKTFRYDARTSVEYWSNITDNAGRSAESAHRSFQVCGLSDVSISASCGNGDPLCEPGESLTITSNYQGACPSSMRIEVNASSGDEECGFNASSSIGRINLNCAKNAQNQCINSYTLPPIPIRCRGKTIVPKTAELFSSGGGWFDKAEPQGRFRLYVGILALTAKLEFTRPNPNLNDETIAKLSCKISAGAESADCVDANTDIRTFSQQGYEQRNLDYYKNSYQVTGHGSFSEAAVWKSAAKRFELPVFTGTLYGTSEAVGFNSGPDNPVTMQATLDYKDPIPGGERIASGSGSDSFTVNFPPEITNIRARPAKVAIGGEINLSASLSDPEGNAFTARICENAACTAAFPGCSPATFAGSGEYSCKFMPQGLPRSYQFYANATDSDAASRAEPGGAFESTEKYLEIRLIFPDAEKKLIPITDGRPDFTKTMPINATVVAKIKSFANPNFVQDCTKETCSAEIKLAGDSFRSVKWDELAIPAPGWVASNNSRNLACDGFYNVTASITVLSVPGIEGLGASKSAEIRINCNPRLIVDPVEVRLTAGQNNRRAFSVRIWDPEERTYSLVMVPGDTGNQAFLKNWVAFNCDGMLSGTCMRTSDSTTDPYDKIGSLQPVIVGGEKIYPEGKVLLTAVASSRAGVYPVRFTATSNPTLEATGTILVFKEGLSEFSEVQLLVLMIMSLPLFFFFAKSGKKLNSAKTSARRKYAL